MISLRKEFNKIFDEDNETVPVIIRHNTETKCNCWRKESNTPDPECGNCEGLGWIFTEWMEMCKVFFATSVRIGQEHEFEFGKTFTQHYSVYAKCSKKNRSVKENDLVYLIETDENGKIINPIKRNRKLIVVGSYDFQTEGGRVDFVKIIAKPLQV